MATKKKSTRGKSTARKKVVVVTGGNRGIGHEVCRQLGALGHRIVLTARNKSKGEMAAEGMRDEGLDVSFHRLDTTDLPSIRRLAKYMEREFGKFDVLINNAGICIDRDDKLMTEAASKLRRVFETNIISYLHVTQRLVPLMRRGGQVINVSSGSAQFRRLDASKMPGYQISKAGLNAMTVLLSQELKKTGIRVNAVAPGWVKTDMGGPAAPVPLKKGADTITWLAASAPAHHSGKFFQWRKVIPW